MSVKLRERQLPSGITQLYLDIYHSGNRRTESLGLFKVTRPKSTQERFQNRETQKQAEEIAAKQRLDFQADEHSLSATHRRKASFLKFLNEQKDLRKNPHTKATWGQAIEHFGNFAGENIAFGDITPIKLDKFKAYLLSKVSANTAILYFTHIKAALAQAVRENILTVNPASQTTAIRRTQTLPVHLSIKEIRKLSKTPCSNDQVKQAFLFSCFSGLRYSDVSRLTWANIKGEYLEFSQTKTGTPENLPLSSEALRILRKQKKAKPSPHLVREIPPGTVFFLPNACNINRILKTWAKSASIDKSLSFHKARHSFATVALSSGIDIYTVSKLLGHKNLATTQVYGKIVDEKKRQAINKFPSL